MDSTYEVSPHEFIHHLRFRAHRSGLRDDTGRRLPLDGRRENVRRSVELKAIPEDGRNCNRGHQRGNLDIGYIAFEHFLEHRAALLLGEGAVIFDHVLEE